MLDHWTGVVIPQLHSGLLQNRGWRVPRLVNPLIRQSCKFRDPLSYISALWIESGCLSHRVEDAKIGGGIGAAARHPLPAEGVAGQVRIDQRVPEPACALIP